MRPPVWAAAAAAAAAILVAFAVVQPTRTIGAPATVMMQSLRGPEAGAHIVHGKPYSFVFDVDSVVAGAGYEVEIVDRAGNRITRAKAVIRAGRLTASVDRLARGSYWVRVYRGPDSGDLVAEYGLQAE
jgi:hypothetical protein